MAEKRRTDAGRQVEPLRDYVRRVVNEAPPLTPAQREALTALMRGAPRATRHD